MTHQALAAGLAMTFMTAPVAAQAATNAIVLHVSRHPGAAASDVAGTAPPFAPIVVTLRALISIDLPIVYVREARVEADASGRFSLTLADSPVTFLPVTFQLTATTSVPGVAPATARIAATPPTPDFRSPVDEIPPEYR